MRIDTSSGINKLFPSLEDKLWNVAVHCKNADPDIKLMGLRVRVKKSPSHWYGWAFPWEESTLYGSRLIHPAGRVDLGIPADIDDDDMIRLFAHELRHIGQYHRGRKIHGFLTSEHMKEERVEADCYEFEKYILGRYQGPRKICTCGAKRRVGGS